MTRNIILLCALIAGIILCGFQQGTAPKNGKANQEPAKTNQKTSETDKANRRSATPGKSSSDSTDKNSKREEGNNYQNVQIVTPEKTIDHVERIISYVGIGCTVALTFVGIIGICVGIKTLRTLRKQAGIMIRQSHIMQRQASTMEEQTKATITAANAAKINADAIINIERAWLIPSDTVTPKALPKYRLTGTQTEQLIVQIQNFGHTPAWLTDWFFGVEILDSNKTDIGEFINAHKPEGDHPYARPFPPGERNGFPIEWKILKPSDLTDIQDGRKKLYVYGFIEYRNTVGKDFCLSQFCFRHVIERDFDGSINQLWVIDPPEWNNYS